MDVDEVSLNEFSSNIDQEIFDSLLTRRVSVLQEIQKLCRKAVDDSALVKISDSVLETYKYYQDPDSRNELLKTLEAYIYSDSTYLSRFTDFVYSKALQEKKTALAGVISLLGWINSFRTIAVELNVENSDVIRKICVAQAQLVDSCLEKILSEKKKQHTKRLYNSVRSNAKTSIKKAFLSSNGSVKVIDEYISALVTPDNKVKSSAVLCLLGLLTEAVQELSPTFPSLLSHLSDSSKKSKILDYYNNEVLLARIPLPDYSLIVFGSYIEFCVTKTDFKDILLPSIDKATLKSSENSFGHALPYLFGSLNVEEELGDVIVFSKFLSNSLNALKSSKENVRRGAFETMKLIILRSMHKSSDQTWEQLKQEFLKSLKTAPSIDVKYHILNCLSFLGSNDISVSLGLLEDLSPIIAREQNEHTMTALANSYASHFFKIMRNEKIAENADLPKFMHQIKSGLDDVRPLRRVWFTEIGQALHDNVPYIKKELLARFYGIILPTFLKNMNECKQLPLPSATNRIVVCAYVSVFIIAVGKKYVGEFHEAKEKALGLFEPENDKPSILADERIFSKITSSVDMLWLLRAIAESSVFFVDMDQNIRTRHMRAWLYIVISKHVSPETRMESFKLLDVKINADPDTMSVILIGLIYLMILEYERDEHNVHDYDLKGLSNVLSIVTQLPDTNLLQRNAKELLIVANHERLVVKNGWIGLCQRAKIDIGTLIKNNSDELFESVVQYLNKTYGGSIFEAAVSALGILTFVNPEANSLKILNLLKVYLDREKIIQIDDNMIQIWKSSKDELVLKALDSKKSDKLDRNTKDYEINKWEEQIRQELSAKGDRLSKLTKEEKMAMNEKLEEFLNTQYKVEGTVKDVRLGFRIINKLVDDGTKLENGANAWYPCAIDLVLGLLEAKNLFSLVNGVGTDTYLHMSDMISNRLGLMKIAVGVATFRMLGVENLRQNYLEEPLLELVGRILFRMKILSDQTPLESLTVAYSLPFLRRVLEVGRETSRRNVNKPRKTSEFSDEDPEEENLLLALDILSAHADTFEDKNISRVAILKVLISLMKLPSKARAARDSFLTICQHVSVNVSSEDLQLLFGELLSSDVFVKTTILESFDSEFDLSSEVKYTDIMWIAVNDGDPHAAHLAATVWEDNDFELLTETPFDLLGFIDNDDAGMRVAISKAIALSTKVLLNGENDTGDLFEKVLDRLIFVFNEKRSPPRPTLDRFGLPIKGANDQKDPWQARSTIAITLKFMASLFTKSSIEKFFHLLIEEQALGDKEETVSQELKDAGVEVIKVHTLENFANVIPVLESSLAKQDIGSTQLDQIKEAVIILYGTAARHFSEGDSRLDMVIKRMIVTLDTPSEYVQLAISDCLAPLVSLCRPMLKGYFDSLFEKLFCGEKMAIRRGAAYGIAGLVKGAGIKSLSEYNLMRTLISAADDLKDPKKREGVSFAFECLSHNLGHYFEPYVIEVLPIILKFLGDPSPEVREATDYAARQIMKNTTSFGVRKLIPLTVSNLDESAWRSKKGSVELLGSMAYLDPTQLSASLSIIVPEIVGVLNDTHKEVRKAADQSLKRFGEVIRNPEIQSIVPSLLNAIGDPTKYTDEALDNLIRTKFVHYIDGPSLALIIHVIHRGMRDRSASTKKKACQIVGNMAILVDSRDLRPYLPSLVAELEVAMVDPVPATRSTAARALGSLVEKLGEGEFPDLIPRLLDTLQDETRTGDRLGSAQALSEVICGLGIEKLEEMLPTILSYTSSLRSSIRASFMPLLLFLPVCFGTQFSPYLNRIIPPILAGLADTDESIRDTSLRAGRLIVKNYAKKAVDFLLPELENGMSDLNYRIRLSSTELCGDLLFQITGISGKHDLSTISENASEVNRNLLDALGKERRDEVLSLLFICRSDVSGIVRNASVDIWKALVANTPKTVKEILDTLVHILVRRLASTEEIQRTIAAHALGDMVRRVGANALSQVLPTLNNSFISSDSDTKQGICVALTELIKSTQYDDLVGSQSLFIETIRNALTDADADVNEAASQAFDALENALGKVVIEEIMPSLMHSLEFEKSESALVALRDIVSRKLEAIFPMVLHKIMSSPMDGFKAKVIATVAGSSGKVLYRYLSILLNMFVDAVINSEGGPGSTIDEINESFDNLLLSVNDEEGVHPLMQQLLSLSKHEDMRKREVIYSRFGNFFAHTNLDFSIYTQDIVSQFVLTLGEKSEKLVKGAFDALSALVMKRNKESLEKFVKPARQSLGISGVKGEYLPGFCLPKGPSCILPIFLHGIMYGNGEQKELSAGGIADIVDKTPPENLRPFATTITGPLIRVIGEKVSPNIKSAILYALTNLLCRIPQFLRPFIPQLQRTFVRSLSDSQDDNLRHRAVIALGKLIEHQPRVDSLVTELVAGAKNTSDKGIKTAMLKGIYEVVENGGKNLSETSKYSILSLIEEGISHVDDRSATSYAKLVGSLAQILSSEEASSIIKSKILATGKEDSFDSQRFGILAINSFLKEAPFHIFHSTLSHPIIKYVLRCAECTNAYLSDNATLAIGKLLLLFHEQKSPYSKESESKEPFGFDEDTMMSIIVQLSKNCLQPQSASPDTRRLSLVVLRTVSRYKHKEVISNYLDLVGPSVFSCIRDPIIPIRLAAEKAYLAIFQLVEDEKMNEFNVWFERKSEISNILGTKIVPRSIGDYTRRVAARLAAVERERLQAGGDIEDVFSDRIEDEKEIWAVGGVEMTEHDSTL